MSEPHATRRLTFSPRHLQAVRMHAASAWPEECCGFLLGGISGRGSVQVHRVLPAANEHPGDRERRFLISPETVLAARREARAAGLEVVGYYHSHTDGSAEPSRHDLQAAWPEASYLIVPVAEGRAGLPRSWRLRADRSGFEEESVARAGTRMAPRSAPAGEVRP